MDSVMGFVILCLLFGILEFVISYLVLWVRDLDFGDWYFEFWRLINRVCFFGFGLWSLVFGDLKL